MEEMERPDLPEVIDEAPVTVTPQTPGGLPVAFGNINQGTGFGPLLDVDKLIQSSGTKWFRLSFGPLLDVDKLIPTFTAPTPI